MLGYIAILYISTLSLGFIIPYLDNNSSKKHLQLFGFLILLGISLSSFCMLVFKIEEML